MKVKVIIGCFLIALVISSCSSIIYAIRGPKYKGKFNASSYPIELDSTAYYMRRYSENNKCGYLKFNNYGVFYGYTSEDNSLSVEELDTITPFENYFIYKKGYLRWEVYHDSYNGYNLYKAKVYTDSIVAWQVGSKRATIRTYYKMK